MSDAGPTIETIEEASGGGHFAITGDDADRVPYLLGLALGVARQHRTERDTWRERVDEMGAVVETQAAELEGLRRTFGADLMGQLDAAEAERDRLRAVAGAEMQVLREFVERVAVAAGVSITWDEADQVGEPGTPKYNDRLIHEVEVAMAGRDRLWAAAGDLVGAAKAWRSLMLTRPLPKDRERVVNAFADAIDAFDPMLSETTEPVDVTGVMGGAAPEEAAPGPEVSPGQPNRRAASWRGFLSTFDLSGETMMGEPLLDVDATMPDESSAGGASTREGGDAMLDAEQPTVERGAGAAITGAPSERQQALADVARAAIRAHRAGVPVSLHHETGQWSIGGDECDEPGLYVCPDHIRTGGYESCCDCGGWEPDDPDHGRLCTEASRGRLVHRRSVEGMGAVTIRLGEPSAFTQWWRRHVGGQRP